MIPALPREVWLYTHEDRAPGMVHIECVATRERADECHRMDLVGTVPVSPIGRYVLADDDPVNHNRQPVVDTVGASLAAVRTKFADANYSHEFLGACARGPGGVVEQLCDRVERSEQERPVIADWLRSSVWTGSAFPPETHAAIAQIADAVERGEHRMDGR